MSEIAREIASQPACWLEAAGRAEDAGEVLPRAGERVAVLGCGTSYFIAQAYAGLREMAGLGETDAFPASEAPTARSYDRVLVISRSGTTTEVLRVLGALPPGIPTVAVTAAADALVVRAAERSIVLEFADERSVVQTRFTTSALAMLRAHLGHDLTPAVADAEHAVRVDLPVDPSRYSHFVFLGHRWTVGLANEAALKLRETAQAWTESYPAMEYRHGPISVAGEQSLVWILGPADAAITTDVESIGATTASLGLDPMAELIAIQRLAVALAEAKGLDPDHPRHLSRSVMLS